VFQYLTKKLLVTKGPSSCHSRSTTPGAGASDLTCGLCDPMYLEVEIVILPDLNLSDRVPTLTHDQNGTQ
jgi:hypothetical protein